MISFVTTRSAHVTRQTQEITKQYAALAEEKAHIERLRAQLRTTEALAAAQVVEFVAVMSEEREKLAVTQCYVYTTPATLRMCS